VNYITHVDSLQELYEKKIDIYLSAHTIAEDLTVKYDVEAGGLKLMLYTEWT